MNQNCTQDYFNFVLQFHVKIKVVTSLSQMKSEMKSLALSYVTIWIKKYKNNIMRLIKGIK